jgi:hypothetical protein
VVAENRDRRIFHAGELVFIFIGRKCMGIIRLPDPFDTMRLNADIRNIMGAMTCLDAQSAALLPEAFAKIDRHSPANGFRAFNNSAGQPFCGCSGDCAPGYLQEPFSANNHKPLR